MGSNWPCDQTLLDRVVAQAVKDCFVVAEGCHSLQQHARKSWVQTTTTHLLWENTKLTCAYLEPPSAMSRNECACVGQCAVWRVLCSQRRRRAWQSTHRHTNGHLGATSCPSQRRLAASRQCHAVLCETVTTGSSRGRTKKQVSLSKQVSWTDQMSVFAKQDENRRQDR